MSESIDPRDVSCLRINEFPRWEPGVRVTVHVPPPEPMEWVVIMGIYGTIFGLMAGFVIYSYFDEMVPDASMGFIEAFVVCAIPISVIGAMHLAGGDETAGTIDLDWETETLRVKRKFSSKEYSFNEFDSLSILAEYRLRGSSSEVRKERIHQARLDANLGKKRVMLFRTDGRELAAEMATEPIRPIAETLASSLGKELVELEPEFQRHKKFLLALWAAPWKLHLAFIALSACATLWISWRAGAN